MESQEFASKDAAHTSNNNEARLPEAVKPTESDQVNRGVKQKAQSPTFVKKQNLLDIVKQEKKQKMDSFSTPGHVLKKPEPEPMEVESSCSQRSNTNEGDSSSSGSCDVEDFIFVSLFFISTWLC